MSQVELIPVVAGLATAVGILFVVVGDRLKSIGWQLPGIFSLLLLLVSLRAVFKEGSLGFWTEHTRNHWGNQIWCDLLLGVSAAIAFMVPRARAMKMNIALWAILCLATGSIGLYAFISRLLFLESRRVS